MLPAALGTPPRSSQSPLGAALARCRGSPPRSWLLVAAFLRATPESLGFGRRRERCSAPASSPACFPVPETGGGMLPSVYFICISLLKCPLDCLGSFTLGSCSDARPERCSRRGKRCLRNRLIAPNDWYSALMCGSVRNVWGSVRGIAITLDLGCNS